MKKPIFTFLQILGSSLAIREGLFEGPNSQPQSKTGGFALI
jgi:hypothetical protein